MITVPAWIADLIEPGTDVEPVVYQWAAMERDVAELALEFAALDVARKIRGLD